MRLRKVLTRPVTCHRLLTVFCSLGMLVSTFGAVSLVVRWLARLDLTMKLLLLVLFVFGIVWFLEALVGSNALNPVTIHRCISGDGE